MPMNPGQPLESKSAVVCGLRLRLDAVREMWRERILDYNQDSQRDLLEMLKIPEPDGQKLVMCWRLPLRWCFAGSPGRCAAS